MEGYFGLRCPDLTVVAGARGEGQAKAGRQAPPA